jgi:Fur family ferric uptake transcriptional regulator
VSVYRTLTALSAIGVVRVVSAMNGTQCFELAEPFTPHHHHAICRRCGTVKDVGGCLLDGRALQIRQRQLRRVMRFRVTDHDVQLLGLCARCGGSR